MMTRLTPEEVSNYLQFYCVGSGKPIHADDLIMGVCGRVNPSLRRDLSDVIAQLRVRGFPICADNKGYFWATESGQVTKLIKILFKRAMTGLRQISKLKAIAIPDLAGQMRLPVGSEPYPPEAVYRSYPVDLQVQIPESLNDDIRAWLKDHPIWDQERLYSAALSLFLLQQGANSRVAARIYTEAYCDED